jgi:surface antigen
VRLGVWLSNTKSRRDKLDQEQRAALAALGMEWAGVVPAIEAAPEPPAPQPAQTPAAPAKRRVREHHEECDEELYEGGNCTCWSIERFGPPSEREHYGDNL